MENDTTSDAMFDHVTVASPVKLPVLFAVSRDSLASDTTGYSTSTVAPPDVGGENSSAIIIVVLSVVVLATIFFTVCGLLVKSQALVLPPQKTSNLVRSQYTETSFSGGRRFSSQSTSCSR